MLACSGDHNRIQLFEQGWWADEELAASGECAATLVGHAGPVAALAAADGLLASGSDDRTARVWDLANGRCVHVLEGHRHAVSSVAMEPGLLATGRFDHTVRLWELANGTCTAVLSGFSRRVLAVAVGLGKVAGADADGQIRVWSTTHFDECLAVLEGHAGPVHALAFGRPASGWLASGGADGKVTLFNV